MDNIYMLVIRTENQTKTIKISDELFQKLYDSICILDEFSQLTFLGNSYLKAKEDFLDYDFSQSNVREIDIFSMFLNDLEAIATNINLWNAYLKRRYHDDPDIFPQQSSAKDRKSCFALKDSAYYDKNVEYVVAKCLRNMIVHSGKPYSSIIYPDDGGRMFIITKEVLFTENNTNASAKKIINASGKDYFDVADVITKAFGILEELNQYIFGIILRKEWIRFYSARLTTLEILGTDWQRACLAWLNPQYPPEHLLGLNQKEFSKHAFNSIGSIAAQIHMNMNLTDIME